MQTDQLIAALQADAASRRWPPSRIWAIALIGGLAAGALVLKMLLVPRPDLATAMQTAPVLFKFALGATLAGAALLSALALSRPGAPLRALAWLALPLVLLAAAVLAEMMARPEAEWEVRMMGRYPLDCLALIPIIGLAPLGLAIAALRHGAPTRPVLAGAVAGMLAGGLAAFLYALHCRDDSPLFVAVWYTTAVLILAGLGALAGRLFVRW